MSDTAVSVKLEVTVGGRFWLNKGRAKIPTRKGDERILAEVAKQFGLTVGVRTRGLLNILTKQYAHTIRDSMVKVIIEQRGKGWPGPSAEYAKRKLAAPRNAHGLNILMFTGHLTRSIKVKSAGLRMDGENVNQYEVYITGMASSPLPRAGDDSPRKGRVWAGRSSASNKELVGFLAAKGYKFTDQGLDEGKREFQAYMRSKNLSRLFYGQDLDTAPIGQE